MKGSYLLQYFRVIIESYQWWTAERSKSNTKPTISGDGKDAGVITGHKKVLKKPEAVETQRGKIQREGHVFKEQWSFVAEDVACFWIVERGDGKVLSRIEYALLYSTGNNTWQNVFPGEDVKCGAGLSRRERICWILGHLLLLCAKCFLMTPYAHKIFSMLLT